MIDRRRHNILGVLVDAVDYEAAVHRVAESAQSGSPLGVSAVAVHGVMSGAMDKTHRYRRNPFWHDRPRWAARSLGAEPVARNKASRSRLWAGAHAEDM